MINRGRLRAQKKRISPLPKRGYACKWCGGDDHYAYTCFKRPQTPIAKESVKHITKRKTTRRNWFRTNKPDTDGQWACYLRISPDCPKMVTVATIDLEHVKAKARHPELAFEVLNIKSACKPCNKLKSSWSVQELAETYPHIQAMIETPEWIEYEKQLTELEKS